MSHSRIDPDSPNRGYYECRSCAHRETSAAHLTACPECGAATRNRAVSRENQAGAARLSV
ncbi:MAG: rubrerythrin-like domain-containing protein [Haloplanus sp.]